MRGNGCKIRTAEDERFIIDEYLNGKTITQIFKSFNGKFKTHKTISDVLKKFNILMKKQNDLIYSNTKNHSYFVNIDTPSKAYLLGILSCDGWLSNTKSDNTYEIGLRSTDKYLIELFKTEIESNNKIVEIAEGEHKFYDTIIHKQKSYQLIINSGALYKSLFDLGFAAKSYDQRIPEALSNYLYPDFIRGLLDGDGCVSATDINLHFQLNGSIICLSQIGMIFHIILGIPIKVPKIRLYTDRKTGKKRATNNVLCNIEYTEVIEIEKIYNYLYPKTEYTYPFLERKKAKFDEWFKSKKYQELRNSRNIQHSDERPRSQL